MGTNTTSTTWHCIVVTPEEEACNPGQYLRIQLRLLNVYSINKMLFRLLVINRWAFFPIQYIVCHPLQPDPTWTAENHVMPFKVPSWQGTLLRMTEKVVQQSQQHPTKIPYSWLWERYYPIIEFGTTLWQLSREWSRIMLYYHSTCGQGYLTLCSVSGKVEVGSPNMTIQESPLDTYEQLMAVHSRICALQTHRRTEQLFTPHFPFNYLLQELQHEAVHPPTSLILSQSPPATKW